MAAVLALGTGALTVSVSASAHESPHEEQTAIVVTAGPAAEFRAVSYIKPDHAPIVRPSIVAVEKTQAKVQAKARAARVAKIRAKVISVAKKQLGDRYSAGSAGPSAFDCSGFTLYVYRVAAGKHLPHYSGAQYREVKKISLKAAKPGDLVFFLRHGAHHVGIYLGKGRMIDAAGYGKGVRISPISGSWWSRSFTGIGRLLPT